MFYSSAPTSTPTGSSHRIYGGQRFFERAEIKDVLAYLRLAQHKGDNAAFERIINWPTRGIGDRTVEQLRIFAREQQCSLWDALLQCVTQGNLAPRAKLALKQFWELMQQLQDDLATMELPEQVEQVMKKSGLLAHYQQEKGESGRARVENLKELITAAKQFVKEQEANDVTHIVSEQLVNFLAHCVLESGG